MNKSNVALAEAKLPSFIKYLKENKVLFKSDREVPGLIFNIYFNARWIPLKRDRNMRGVLPIDPELNPLLMNFMRRKPTHSVEPVLPGCTYDTTQMKGKTFTKCPECSLLVIPGVPHPTTKTLSNGKIVYV